MKRKRKKKKKKFTEDEEVAMEIKECHSKTGKMSVIGKVGGFVVIGGIGIFVFFSFSFGALDITLEFNYI